MPNPKYVKGVGRENEIAEWFEARGWATCTSRGSRSPVDVLAAKAGEPMFAVQVKAGAAGKGHFRNFPPAERNALLAWAAKAGAVPVLCSWRDGQLPAFFTSNEWPTNQRGKPDYVVNEDGCWVWQKSTQDGYGRCNRGGKLVMAHRWYYEQAVGLIEHGLELDHLCCVRLCVNPKHMEPVTRTENIRRTAITKLTAEQVREIRRSKESHRALALQYGVGTDWIYCLRKGKRWLDVPLELPLAVSL